MRLTDASGAVTAEDDDARKSEQLGGQLGFLATPDRHVVQEKTCALYRHFAADGSLLYVGISLTVLQRLGDHAKNSEWFNAISKVTIEHFETRDLALAAEQLAIAREKPKHNIVHKKKSINELIAEHQKRREDRLHQVAKYHPADLETRSTRLRLPVRRKPYTMLVRPGFHLLYRRNQRVGMWIVRAALGKGHYWTKGFAHADDLEAADGVAILDYWQALDRARSLARNNGGEAIS